MLRIKLRTLKRYSKREKLKPDNVDGLDFDATNSIERNWVENKVDVENTFTDETINEVFENRIKEDAATLKRKLLMRRQVWRF